VNVEQRLIKGHWVQLSVEAFVIFFFQFTWLLGPSWTRVVDDIVFGNLLVLTDLLAFIITFGIFRSGLCSELNWNRKELAVFI
jgi:hypothetical protein